MASWRRNAALIGAIPALGNSLLPDDIKALANQSLLIVNSFLWHLLVSNFTGSAPEINCWMSLKVRYARILGANDSNSSNLLFDDDDDDDDDKMVMMMVIIVMIIILMVIIILSFS